MIAEFVFLPPIKLLGTQAEFSLVTGACSSGALSAPSGLSRTVRVQMGERREADMTTVALIPTYQPDCRLLDLVEALCARGVEGVVVDDGSGMRYRPLFKLACRFATVIGYGENHGKGHALKQGLRYIQQHYPEDTVVVTVDADGQHDPADVLRCAQEAQSSHDTMVLGCRSFEEEGVPLRSRLGNKLTREVYHLVSGACVSDTQTGLRAFPAALISFLVAISGERYEYEMNVLLACPAQGVEIREVPVTTIYEEDNASSHFRPVQDSLRIYGGILTFAASSLASFMVDYGLFWLLSTLLVTWGDAGVAVSNVVARLVSASFNFQVNRQLVFRSIESLYVTAVRYALLALSILVANTLSVLLLVDLLRLPAALSKLVVELGFFLFSWVLQSRFVFQGRRY